MALFDFTINQLKRSLKQEELVEYCGLGLHKPTGYATSEPSGGESPEKLAETAEKWLASEKTLSLQMVEGVEARGLIWDSHTPLGEGRVLQNPL